MEELNADTELPEQNRPPCVIVTVIPRKDAEDSFSYRCNFCHYASLSMDLISKHVKEHIFKCSLCDYWTPMQHQLLQHRDKQHGRPHPLIHNLLSLNQLSNPDNCSKSLGSDSVCIPQVFNEKTKTYRHYRLSDPSHSPPLNNETPVYTLSSSINTNKASLLGKVCELQARWMIAGSKKLKSKTAKIYQVTTQTSLVNACEVGRCSPATFSVDSVRADVTRLKTRANEQCIVEQQITNTCMQSILNADAASPISPISSTVALVNIMPPAKTKGTCTTRQQTTNTFLQNDHISINATSSIVHSSVASVCVLSPVENRHIATQPTNYALLQSVHIDQNSTGRLDVDINYLSSVKSAEHPTVGSTAVIQLQLCRAAAAYLHTKLNSLHTFSSQHAAQATSQQTLVENDFNIPGMCMATPFDVPEQMPVLKPDTASCNIVNHRISSSALNVCTSQETLVKNVYDIPEMCTASPFDVPKHMPVINTDTVSCNIMNHGINNNSLTVYSNCDQQDSAMVEAAVAPLPDVQLCQINPNAVQSCSVEYVTWKTVTPTETVTPTATVTPTETGETFSKNPFFDEDRKETTPVSCCSIAAVVIPLEASPSIAQVKTEKAVKRRIKKTKCVMARASPSSVHSTEIAVQELGTITAADGKLILL